MRVFLFFVWFLTSMGFSPKRFPRRNLSPLASDPSSFRKYPFSQKYFERYIRQLNSKNFTERDEAMFSENVTLPRIQIIINKNMLTPFLDLVPPILPESSEEDDEDTSYEAYRKKNRMKGRSKKSDHFELVENSGVDFRDVGGYDVIKNELEQCVDLLTNYTKYSRFNVRTPKGLILEGLPGNGKTLLAKALAGEAGTNFIAVSGAEFQDKYVGVGPGKIRELFRLASENLPCIIFIDEIDALGRVRSRDGESSSAERDNTLNELLVALDGFKNTSGVFLIGATNRADLLDPALIRPGRIDKRIYIGNPDEKTRQAIIRIHSLGKPRASAIKDSELVDMTVGFSGAQIENLLNEAMLNALRNGREEFGREDLEMVCNKMMVGWQPTEHEFSDDIIDRIAIHEMGHAVVGMLSKHHSKVTKVIINLSAPQSPGYTVFENSNTNIYTREALFEHLMVLLGGRIAEEQFWGVSVTTGAINDFEEVLKLAYKMITYYGMGKQIIYPNNSEKYKEIVDNEILFLIQDAYKLSRFIIDKSAGFIFEGAELLKDQKIVSMEELMELLILNYPDLLDLRIE